MGFDVSYSFLHTVCIFLLGHLSVHLPLVHFLFIFEFHQELLVHLCSLYSSCCDKLERGDLWKSTSSPGPIFSPGPCPWDSSKDSLEEAKVCCLEIQGCRPAFSHVICTFLPCFLIFLSELCFNVRRKKQWMVSGYSWKWQKYSCDFELSREDFKNMF